MTVEILNQDDCIIELIDNFYDSKHIIPIIKTLPFETKQINMFGKKFNIPRKTCSIHFNDKPQIYSYSGIKEKSIESPAELKELKSKIEDFTQSKFNYALLNYYKDGNDSINQHSDDEKSIEKDSTIASISFGQERNFIMKNKKSGEKIIIPLKSGSLLLMKGKTQEKWTHGINKTKKKCLERYNITFRLNKL
jgi:alkylated DNA repair dioxygenase AlkB